MSVLQPFFVMFFRPGALVTALLLPLLLSWAAPAVAGETSWAETLHARARLITGTDHTANGARRLVAGIHVQLEKGWKTYWRNPGDAGLPPSFDWSGSRNVKSATVLWPAPKRFPDPYGASIGYKNEVVFPVLVEPEDPARPVDLRVHFEYAVCLDVCIPAEAKLAARIEAQPRASSAHAALLARYLKRVPAPAGTVAGAPELRDLEIDLSSGKPHITIDAAFPSGTQGADIFVEVSPPLYIPMTRKISEQPGGVQRYRIDLAKGDDPAELKGKTLTFTLVSNASSCEVKRMVD
ncbi:MAG: protein-disulfide reductase DsbD family protein [Methyloligellaceae bacterium]